MSKSVKIFSIILLILFVIFSCYKVSATDIDMNIVDESSDSNTVDTNTTDSPDNTDDPTAQTPSDSVDGQLSPSGVGAIQEDGLSLSNILNIFVITIGVILILLAIAIIIRLNK